IGVDAGATLDSQDVDIMIPAFQPADVAKPYQAFDCEQVADQDDQPSHSSKAARAAQSPSSTGEKKKSTNLRGLISMEFEKTEPTFASWVKGPLDAVMGVAVLSNLALLAAMSQEVGYQADVSLGLAQPGAGGMSQRDYEAIDVAFFFVYLTDVCVRMLVLRGRWLYHHGIMYMNLFDAFLVIVHAVEIALAAEANGQTSAAMRAWKLLRLVRTVRVIRTVAVFRELRLLVSTMLASLGTFFWSIVLLALVKVTMALILCQLLQDFILDEQKDLETRLQMNLFYGSFFKSLFTMFEVTFSGSWPTRFRPIVDRVDPWYALLLLSFG
ncbi:Scn11a, partial [Symbiodinium microadriaticum]